MLETTYNASGAQFYDESIAALSKEKKRLEFRLQMLQDNKAGHEKLTYIFTGIFTFWTVLGVVLLVYHPLYRIQSYKFGISYFVIFGLLLLITFFRVIGMDKTGVDLIATDILEIERKIYEIEQKATREHKAIISDELKPKTGTNIISSNSNPPIPRSTSIANDAKLCPICTKTVHAAALFCSFCGYRF